jgi:competence ComEA-like helix-hairpin-helix protein
MAFPPGGWFNQNELITIFLWKSKPTSRTISAGHLQRSGGLGMKGHLILMVCAGLLACTQAGGPPVETTRMGLELKVPGDYATIQEALNAAVPGDTVVLAPGDYTGNITMHDSVTLAGSGPENTIIRGQVRWFGSDGVSVTGVKVTADGASGYSPDVGINVDGEIFTVSGTVVEGFGSGIGVDSTVEGEITGNIVRNNKFGIEINESAAVLISNNVVNNNSHGGIVLFSGYFALDIVHNTVVGNGFASGYDTGGAGIVVGPFITEKVRNNIIVSNRGGINSMEAGTSNNRNNLVWGNLDNYVGAASAGEGDLSLDPMFVNPGNKNFRLEVTSPAVDTALVWAGIAMDFDGHARVVGDLPDMGAYELQEVSADGDFIITEVMANPLAEGTGEFVELFNPTAGLLDAAGLVLDDGDATDIVVGWDGGSTEVPAGGYAVILDKDYELATGPYDIPPEAVLLTVPNKTLGSGLSTNDTVTIARDGAQISTYLHPFDPGNGLSAEKVVADEEDTADNWVPSACGASPGKANCISSGEGPDGQPTIIITEVMAWPVNQKSEEFVEVYNFGDVAVELTGLHITDGDATDSIVAVSGKASLLPPGQLGVIIDPNLTNIEAAPYFLDGDVPVVVTVGNSNIGNGLTGDDSLVIMNTDGATVVATFSRSMYIKHQSVERIDPQEADIFDNWMQCPCPDKHSAGRPNCAYNTGSQTELPVLTITEVMANPLDEDRGEFVELYNPGDEPVNLGGFMISDGDASDILGVFEPGGSLVIPAGGYGLILDPEYDGTYSIPDGVALMQPENTTLGNGLSTTDPVTLLAANGTTAIATFSYPFNPGNGISVERKGQSGDVQANWVASTCPSGSSPGADNCSAENEEPVTDPDPAEVTLVISEVMANPLVESTEEFIELVNVGTQAIDLAGYLISDGDSVDDIEGFDGGPTLMAPGDYALILDAQYPADGPYTVPGNVVLLTTDDLSIGNGLANNDPVTLLELNGSTAVATYQHPFNAGDGVSVERIDLQTADIPGNWVVSPCEAGSSPGMPNCATGDPESSGITVVDINTASPAELQQVTGIGAVTAAAVVSYRESNGPYDALVHLTVLDGVTTSKIADWQAVEEGDAEVVIGLDAAKEVKVFTQPGDLLAVLPAADAPDAGAWDGALVRIKRAAVISQDGAQDNQELIVGDWGDETLYEPNGIAQIPVYLGLAPNEEIYSRDQTDHVNALADWKKEDSDPYLVPNFYRWSSLLPGWGKVAYGSVFALEGVVELHDGEWRIRVRAKADAGLDRLVMIERWLPADVWQGLTWIWSYSYKPVVMETTYGYTLTIPYRLALAHPCRQLWLETHGESIVLPVCFTGDNCTPGAAGGWNLFNIALAEWKETPVLPPTGYCFTYSNVEYCFNEEEEASALDILNTADMGQLKDHCYTTTMANVILAKRPFASIEAYDATSGVGPKSLWNLLVCYVQSGDWPPAPSGSLQEVLQDIPENEWECVTVDGVEVSWINGKLFEVCDQGTEYCIKAYANISVPPAMSEGSIISIIGQVRYYEAGNYWNLNLISYCGSVNVW